MLYYPPFLPKKWRGIAAGGYGMITPLAFLILPRRRRSALAAAVVFAFLLILFLWTPASNDRDWQPEVAVTPWAQRVGGLIAIRGVRNLDYRTETDFTPRWETRTYDLNKLDSVDLVAVYWAATAIAYIMLSFGFEGKDYIAGSIETRKEKGKRYSTLAGFFSPVRVGLRRCRRARCHRRADDLSPTPGRRLHLSSACVAREYPPRLFGLYENHQRDARTAAFL